MTRKSYIYWIVGDITKVRAKKLNHRCCCLAVIGDAGRLYVSLDVIPVYRSLLFLIAELALASHSIPSFTLSSPSLLSPVLESHPPSAIIVDGSILPHTLELIYELNEHEHHYVVVVGETDEKALSKASAHRYHAMVRRRSTRQGGRTDNQPSSR
jgi:hypothetical protein